MAQQNSGPGSQLMLADRGTFTTGRVRCSADGVSDQDSDRLYTRQVVWLVS